MTVKGVGGVFFKADDPEALREWYAEHLGLEADEYGVTFRARDAAVPSRIVETIWSPFPEDTEYLDPSDSSWMINFRVDDIESVVVRLAEGGVRIVDDIESTDYGRFAWFLDLEGNKIELWEPPDSWEGFDDHHRTDADEMTGVYAAPPGTTIAAQEDRSERVIHKQAVLDVPVDTLWWMWTTSEGMASWWTQHNQVELFVGGSMELQMDSEAPAGKRGSERCRILSYLPEKMLSFTWNAPPSFEYTRRRHTHVVLEFEETSGGESALELHHLGWPETDWEAHAEWAETFEYFERAWDQVFELLAASAE